MGLLLLLLLDLLLMLLRQILQEVLLQMIVRYWGIQLLAQGECLLLMSQCFGRGLDLRLDFLALQLLELEFELSERLLLIRMGMLRWPWSCLI